MKYLLPEDLYSYQKEDYKKILTESNWLDTSEMGTGKTPISLAVVEEGGFKAPLIVCPNSLRFEWARQIEEWVSPDKCAVCKGDTYSRLGPILESYRNGQKYKIINYETLRSPFNMEVLDNLRFDIITFDEIHKLRNPKTGLVTGKKEKDEWGRPTKATKTGVWHFLSTHPEAKIIGLSGSPIMNYPNDLYVPLSVIDPTDYHRDLTSWRNFMYRYCLWSDGQYGAYIYGTKNMWELKEKMAPFTIRRTKKEVLPFLPDKYYQRTELEMPTDQRKLYNDMRDELCVLLDTGEPLWSTSVLSTLTRLRQINLDPKILGISAGSAKTEYLMDLVDDTIRSGNGKDKAEGDKLVIFSTFEKYIYLLSTIYFKDIPHVLITGQVPPDKRSEAVKAFQEDPNIKLALCTIQTGGEGITLTASSRVILADRWWNEPTNQQAVSRLHRIGQKNATQVLYPIVKDSADEILDNVLQRKQDANQDYLSENQVRSTVINSIRSA